MIDHAVLQALHPKTLLVFLRGGDDWTFEAAAHEGLSGVDARLPTPRRNWSIWCVADGRC